MYCGTSRISARARQMEVVQAQWGLEEGVRFLNSKTMLKWIAFVVAFINLALEEVR